MAGFQSLAPQQWDGVHTYQEVAPSKTLRRTMLAKPIGAMREDVAALHGFAPLADYASVAARQVMAAAEERLRGLPLGSSVAVKHEGDGRLAWMEFAPGEPVVVPDASWTAFKRRVYGCTHDPDVRCERCAERHP